MKYLLILGALAVSVNLTACNTRTEMPLAKMTTEEVRQKVLGHSFLACHRASMKGISTQDFTVPGKYTLTIHNGPRAGTYEGKATLDESGGIRISDFNGPDGSDIYWVLNTDGKNIYVDRTPPHPRYPQKNYLWLNCP